MTTDTTSQLTTESITVHDWAGYGFTIISELSNGESFPYTRKPVNPHNAAVQILRLGADLPRSYVAAWSGEPADPNQELEGIIAISRDTFCARCASLSGVHDQRCPVVFDPVGAFLRECRRSTQS